MYYIYISVECIVFALSVYYICSGGLHLPISKLCASLQAFVKMRLLWDIWDIRDMIAYFCFACFCECAFIVFKLWTSATVRALVTHVVAPVADLGQD